MKEILFFAPTQSMLKRLRLLIKKHNIQNVQAEFGDVNISINNTAKYISDGIKVIISRGGTYNFFKRTYNIPVVEVKVDVVDVLNSYNEFEASDGNVAIVGFRNVIYGFEYINKIIPNNVSKIYLDDEKTAYRILKSAVNMGITNFIGDTAVNLIKGETGVQTSVIDSRDEKLLEAIDEANLIIDTLKKEERIKKQTEVLTDFLHEGIASFDVEGNFTVFNNEAERLLRINKMHILGKHFSTIFPNLDIDDCLINGKKILEKIITINDKELLINIRPIQFDNIIHGAVLSFRNILEVSETEHKIRRSKAENGFVAKFNFDDIIRKSEKTEKCIELAKKYSLYDSPILIYGKSGVGKEMYCQSIHNAGPRKDGPFVAINCAAIPPTLMESELFGHEEGAFTGARKKGKAGMFELAHSGTIFLDEISELPYEFQGRLLRVLQEKQIVRVGGDKVIPIDVRIICASNRNLYELMKEFKFRDDLFFRINILNLSIPSLIERKEDILCLAEFFINKYSYKYKTRPLEITDSVKENLTNREYIGNVRELEGLMERCVVLESFDTILNDYTYDPPLKQEDYPSEHITDLKTYTQNYIEKIYQQTNCSTKQTCDILKINRTTLWKKLGKED